MISVAMVNFNGGELVSRAVSSVLASRIPVEVILVDNASGDGSPAALRNIFESDDRVTLIFNRVNRGFAVASNQALARAQGAFLLLLNPDCLVGPDTLESMLGVLENHPRAGMAGCRILDPDGSEQRGCRRTLPTPGSGFRRAFRMERLLHRDASRTIDLYRQPLPEAPVEVEAISGAFMLVRRQALETVGFLDEGYFLHCEDLDWCRRFRDAGWRILFVPGVEVVHHQGSCSQDRPVRVEWHKHRGMARYYRKFLQGGPLVSALVHVGIAARFGAVAGYAVIRKLVPRGRD